MFVRPHKYYLESVFIRKKITELCTQYLYIYIFKYPTHNKNLVENTKNINDIVVSSENTIEFFLSNFQNFARFLP